MSRKIELQRKQFGLVLPPPPQLHPEDRSSLGVSNEDLQREQTTGANGSCVDVRPESQFAEGSSIDNVPPIQTKKLVRFHTNLERVCPAPTSVSDVLENLKQRHSKAHKSSLRKRKFGKMSSAHDKQLHNDDSAADDGESQSHSSSFSSMKGILDELQKRHDRYSLKRKRTAEPLLKMSEDDWSMFPQKNSGLRLDPERLDFGDALEADESMMSHCHAELAGKTIQRIADATPLTQLMDSPSSLDDSFTYRSNEADSNNDADADCMTNDSMGSSADIDDKSCYKSDKNNNQLSGHLMENGIGVVVKSTSTANSQQHRNEYSSEKYEGFEPNSPTYLQSGGSLDVDVPESGEIERHSCMGSYENKRNPAETSTSVIPKRSIRPDLFFSGIVVLVNGHTNPDATTLMRLLHKHGGDLEKYETRRVTHIIAERLSTAKANIYKKQQKPTPVCRPEWITESVEKGALLPFGDYLLQDVMDAKAPRTKSLKSFFGADAASAHSEADADRCIETDPSKSKYHINGVVRTVGNDPNFLESYFGNSRLSYIGSFKQRVKALEVAGTRPPKAGSQRFVLLVDLDCFFASVALKNFPQYRKAPVAVGHSPTVDLKNADGIQIKVPSPSKVTNSSSELSTCNYIARKFGVKKGMFLGDAIKLCPQLVVLPYDFPQYESVSGIVAEKLHFFADQFNGFVEQVSCDESYIEINVSPQDHTGQPLDNFLSSLAERIRLAIFEATDCTASIGVGRNKLLAKLAADKVKPDASCVVKDWQDFLDGLALRDLHGIGRKIEKKLTAHSLCSVNDIWELGGDAERVVGEIVGPAIAQKIVQFCNGKDDRPVRPQLRKTIGAECNYGVRFDGLYGPDYMIKGLADEVEKRMTTVSVRGSKLTLKIMKSKDPTKMPEKFLGHGRCENVSKSTDIPLTRNCEVFCSAALKLYEKIGVDKESIRGMGLVVSSLESDAEDGSSPSKLSSWLKSDQKKSVVEEVRGRNSPLEHHNDFESNVPRYSQLDQDVLTELPEDILKEVKSMYGECAESSPRRATTPSLHPSRQKQGRKVEKTVSIPGQPSVKRMLKLAMVKSGKDKLECNNDEFTLSQLDCLPLETQLQIANGDDVILKSEAPLRPSTRRSIATNNIDGLESHFVDNHNNKTMHLFQKSRDFYFENIQPLQEFIKSNPHPDHRDIKVVLDFLTVCVEEHCLEDVIVFLRSIKGMQRGWDVACYEHVKEHVVREVYRSRGYLLDTVWLGL
eukprot:CCRYP_007848-RB/>CCRYP_007848-RB protein AED:0.23 eAED:0.23 QI:295/1/1/1/0.6/0.5/6/2116/1238